MGYRSEVILAVHKSLMGKFLAKISQTSTTKEFVFSRAEVIENYKGEGNFLFRWQDVKWYEGYEDIDTIHGFMHDVDEMERWIPSANFPDGRARYADELFKFIRIGEDIGDCEERGHAFESDIYMTRGITF